MMRLFVISFCLSLCVTMITAQWEQRMFRRDPGRAMSCDRTECPRYTVLQRFNGYELRRYDPIVWVATNSTSNIMRYEQYDRRNMFWKLFRYISGNNYRGMKIDMTAPVLTRVERPLCADCGSNHVMYFMLPAIHQINPPFPRDMSVYLVSTPQMEVYVKYYGGYSNPNSKMQHLIELQGELSRDGNSFDNSHYVTAGYDSPMTRGNRHNEIWLQRTVRQIYVMS